MTIRRGAPWGTPGPLAAGAPVVVADADLHRLVVDARRRGVPVGEVGLLGGDLCRSLGGPGDAARLRGPDAVRLPVDVVRVDLDDVTTWFAAHLVGCGGRLRGPAVVAMNGDWMGELKLGPRAHPNDGLVDVTVGRVPWRQRRVARQRARSGTHVPHPALRERRAARVELDLRAAVRVVADGVPVGRSRHLVLTVEPDAFVAVV